jgi:hypothetical protein
MRVIWPQSSTFSSLWGWEAGDTSWGSKMPQIRPLVGWPSIRPEPLLSHPQRPFLWLPSAPPSTRIRPRRAILPQKMAPNTTGSTAQERAQSKNPTKSTLHLRTKRERQGMRRHRTALGYRSNPTHITAWLPLRERKMCAHLAQPVVHLVHFSRARRNRTATSSTPWTYTTTIL